MEQELMNKLGQAIKSAWEDVQSREDQYVVQYKRMSDDSLIGYHASSFCQVTEDILKAKRYSDEPYEQLKVIAKNLRYALRPIAREGMFGEIYVDVQDNAFANLCAGDIYLDYQPLTEGTPKQECRWVVVNPNDPIDESLN